MSYKYVNGCYEVTIEIRHGFKRFHSMNAQESFFRIKDESGDRFVVWQFVSYATDMIQVVHDLEYDEWIVSCNGNPFSYSPSTSRQVSRWIRESSFRYIFTPQDIRNAYDNCLPVTQDIASYSIDNVCFDFHSPYTFHNVWR